MDGNYTLKGITPGTYDLTVTYVGYQELKIEGIVITAGKITFKNIQMIPGGSEMFQCVVMEAHRMPLVENDVGSGYVISSISASYGDLNGGIIKIRSSK
jgi:hypothetical protein